MAARKSEGEQRDDGAADVIVIKKYANRRLYNTSTSSYVTLEHLSEMVRENKDFVVQDAKTGDDITRSVLTQIIFEQENRGQNLLPVQFLRRLIRFYGDQMQGYVPAYLEMSMESFAKSQEQIREHLNRAFGGKTPMAAFEEQAKQNMALFQQALSVWSPFVAARATDNEAASEDDFMSSRDTKQDAELDELKKQLEAMQRQLDVLTKPRKPGA